MQSMGGWLMPTLFKYGQYRIYFWSNENGEPIHVHVSKGAPKASTTKIWLLENGMVLLAHNKSRIPEKDLAIIMATISRNSRIIKEAWYKRFNYIRFYM